MGFLENIYVHIDENYDPTSSTIQFSPTLILAWSVDATCNYDTLMIIILLYLSLDNVLRIFVNFAFLGGECCDFCD